METPWTVIFSAAGFLLGLGSLVIVLRKAPAELKQLVADAEAKRAAADRAYQEIAEGYAEEVRQLRADLALLRREAEAERAALNAEIQMIREKSQQELDALRAQAAADSRAKDREIAQLRAQLQRVTQEYQDVVEWAERLAAQLTELGAVPVPLRQRSKDER